MQVADDCYVGGNSGCWTIDSDLVYPWKSLPRRQASLIRVILWASVDVAVAQPTPRKRREALSPVDSDFEDGNHRELTPSRAGHGGGIVEYPQWLFPVHFSDEVRALLIELLDPDPSNRPSVADAMEHPWVRVIADEDEGSFNLSDSGMVPLAPAEDDDDGISRTVEEELPVPTMICGSAPVSTSPVYKAMMATAERETAAETVQKMMMGVPGAAGAVPARAPRAPCV